MVRLMLLGEPSLDRRTRRHEATRQEIVAAAWDVAREKGVAAVSLTDVAARVGMRVPSLYSYFESKHDVYDAMFAQGSADFVEAIRQRLDTTLTSPRERVRRSLRIYFDFCTQDPTRYQLLFQRTIPGFVPSAESFAVATEALAMFRDDLADIGVVGSQADHDLLTALGSGLVDQQIANDPGGDRWARLVDDVADMAFDHLMAQRATTSTTSRTGARARTSRSRR